MLEHRPVLLMKDVHPDMDPNVRIDADYVRVVRRMVDRTEAEAVGDERLTLGMPIGEDVRGIEQLHVSEPADAALLLIGEEHHVAELLLMEPLGDRARSVLAPRRGL